MTKLTGEHFEIHKRIAQRIGGTVDYDGIGYKYIDERGKPTSGHRENIDDAYQLTDEDWTFRITDAMKLFIIYDDLPSDATPESFIQFHFESLYGEKAALELCKAWLSFMDTQFPRN